MKRITSAQTLGRAEISYPILAESHLGTRDKLITPCRTDRLRRTVLLTIMKTGDQE